VLSHEGVSGADVVDNVAAAVAIVLLLLLLLLPFLTLHNQAHQQY
jgi:hypothetical protein